MPARPRSYAQSSPRPVAPDFRMVERQQAPGDVPRATTASAQLRIVVLYPGNGFLRSLAEDFPSIRFDFHEAAEAALADAADCDAAISFGRFMTRDVAEALFGNPRLRWIQIGSAGTDLLDGVTPPPGVVLTRAAGILDAFVAEQALALLLALGRRLHEAVRNQVHGAWGLPRDGFESVAGKRATVLGFGGIGRAIATRLLALGAEVTGVSRNPAPLPGARLRSVADLPSILPESEILLLALPGGAATAGMIGRKEIARLPRGAMLVNVGRGASLDHAALAQALRDGHLAGAGLDVTEPEPLPPGHALWSCPNLIISPHVGGRDRRQPESLRALFAANIARFLSGQDLLHCFSAGPPLPKPQV